MLIKKFSLLLILSSATVFLPAQAQELRPLVPGQPVEREIAGGQVQDYRIALQAGQFVRVVAEPKAVDVALVLADPGGKQVAEVNLTGFGGLESLSAEAAAGGDYRLTVRGAGSATLAGSYRVRLEVRATTPQDRRRIAAEALLREADGLRKQGRKTAEQEIDKLQQALAVWRELGDQYWAARSLYNIGVAYSSLNRYEKAIEYYEQALTIAREVKDRPGEGSGLNSLGVAYRLLGRYEKAIEYYEQALAIRREMKDRAGEGTALNSLGNAYRFLGRYDKAIEYHEQSLAISREMKDRAGESSPLNNLGNVYSRLGRYEKSIEYYEQALAIYREVKNRADEGASLNNLGVAYRFLGRYEKAIEYLEQSLAIKREVKDRAGEGLALNNLGITYGSLGRYEKAIEYHEQALAIRREVKNRDDEGTSLNNLGNVYSRLGRYDKAVEYFEQALAIYREVKNRAGEGLALNNLGIAYRGLGRYDKAIEYYEQSLAISREVKDRAGEGSALNNLGNAYSYLSRHEKAIEHHEQALAIRREVKDRAGEGSSLNNLGVAYRGLGRYDKAVEYSEQALAITREVKNRAGEAVALKDLAYSESARGNLAAARARVEESLKVSEAMRAEVISPESRASFLADVQSSYQLYTDVLMRQHRAEPTKGFDALAVETSERQRARSLLDLLAEANTDVRQGVDTALIERERALAKQLNDKARANAATPEAAAALKLEISRLETELERAQAAIRKDNPRYAALTQPQPLKLAEIQAQLDADTLLLEYALGSERSYLWAITRDSLASYELPKGELIEKEARQVYELLTARSTNQRGESAVQRRERITQAETKLPAAAHSLSRTLLAPVATQLGNKRLVIVADGALQYIPFSMLPEPRSLDFGLGSSSNPVVQDTSTKPKGQRPKTEDQPLIVNHEVVSLPSASALAIQRSELAGRQPAPKMLAVIADPVFDRSDSRFTTPATDTSDKAPTQTINADDARSIEHLAGNSGDKSGVTTLRLIPRLPFTRQEATRVLALTPKNSSFGAIDFNANRATVLSGNLSQYRYVHFATHGVLDSERPGLSSLLLSMVDAQGKPVDGFLRANDIYNLKLPAELVVLSACQTGLGKEIKGEGLVGLTRGFMYAGAARVVVSLWNVNDKATADLMTKFYEKMLKQGERPAAALRAAQVEMWRQKQWQSPYYWAAFTMQGEWR